MNYFQDRHSFLGGRLCQLSYLVTSSRHGGRKDVSEDQLPATPRAPVLPLPVAVSVILDPDMFQLPLELDSDAVCPVAGKSRSGGCYMGQCGGREGTRSCPVHTCPV